MSDIHAKYDEADRLKVHGDLEGATAKFREILEQDPNFALAHAALSIVLQKQGMHLEAIAHAEKVCELEPNDAFSFTSKSVIYQRAFAGTGDRSYIQLAEQAMDISRRLTQQGHGH